jgi:CubicO group peptidase (beta-lactamase class C family)
VRAAKRVAKFTLYGVTATATLLVVGLFAFTAVIRYPDPVSAYQLATSINSQQPDLMPSHRIAASATPHQWPVARDREQLPAVFSHEGVEFGVQRVLQETATHAFLIVRNGEITYEWYSPEWSEDRLMNTMSVGKTLVGIAAGILIAEGKLRERDSITTHLPRYERINRLDEVTVKHLLDMQSCIGVAEEYPEGPEGWLSPIAQMFATTDIEHVLDRNLSVICDPGSEEYVYRSVNSQLLGMIVTEVSGQSLSEFLSDRVWQPLGATTDASWSVDRIGGYEKSYCCFNATARDLALVGSMFLAEGKVPFGARAGQSVISEDWFARMSTPTKKWFGGYGAEHFGAHLWHEPNDQLLTQGYRGQLVWMNPFTNTVVVKLSDDVESRYYDEVKSMLSEISFGGR